MKPKVTKYYWYLQDSNRKNLAKGDGGMYRYLNLNSKGNAKICDIKLYRISKHDHINDLPVDGHSNDINYGRSNESLYLVWNHVCIERDNFY